MVMKSEQKLWLEAYAVTCRVFKGRWSVRHCLRMYNDMRDLKIRMASRAHGKITRHESAYNPCERCKVLEAYMKSCHADSGIYENRDEAAFNQVWAV